MFKIVAAILPSTFLGYFIVLKNSISLKKRSIIFFGLTLFIVFILHYDYTFSQPKYFLMELKICLIILILSKNWNIQSKNLSNFFIIFSIITLLYVFLSTGSFLRWIDILPFKFGLISVTYSWLGILFLHLSNNFKRKAVIIFLILINGSGTGLIGLITYFIASNFRKMLNVRYLSLLIIILFFLYLGQSQRGRSIEDFENIDRFILWATSVNTIIESPLLLIVPDLTTFIDNWTLNLDNYPLLKEYILIEHDYVVTASMTHSDQLRIISAFGIIGLIIFYKMLFKKLDKSMFFSLFFMGLFNPILYSNVFLASLPILLSKNK